jgi:hypothetical protein
MEKLYYHKWMPSVFPLPSTLSYGAAYTAEGAAAVLQWANESDLRDKWMHVSTSSEEEEEEKEKGGAWVRRGRGYRWHEKQEEEDYYKVDEAALESLYDDLVEEGDVDYGGDEKGIEGEEEEGEEIKAEVETEEKTKEGGLGDIGEKDQEMGEPEEKKDEEGQAAEDPK